MAQNNRPDLALISKWNDRFPQLQWDSFVKMLTNNLPIDSFNCEFIKLSGEQKKISLVYPSSKHETEHFSFSADSTTLSADNGLRMLKFYISPDDKTIQLNIFKMLPKKSHFTQLLYNIDKIAETLEYNAIHSTRTLKFSLYAQSKLGFLAANNGSLEHIDTVRSNYDHLVKNNLVEFKSVRQKQLVDNLFKNLDKDSKNIWKVIDIDIPIKSTFQLSDRHGIRYHTPDGITLGKAVVFDVSTTGYYDCKDPDVRERMRDYFTTKQIKKISQLESSIAP